MRFSFFRFTVSTALAAWLAGLAHGADPVQPADPGWPAVREAAFAAVWQTVNDAYFDPKFGGVDWPAVREKYHPGLEHVTGNPELRQLLQAMLDELHRTHFAILPREAAVFQPSERPRIGTVGAELVYCDGQVTFAAVRAGLPAAAAGIVPGETVEVMDNHNLAEARKYLAQSGLSEARQGLLLTNFVIGRLESAVGTKVQLTLGTPAGESREVALTCSAHTGLWSEPIGDFPAQPIEIESRRLPGDVSYLQFNLFVPQLMKTIRTVLVGLKPEDGLIFDLRGNRGGLTPMAPGISGWLVRSETSLGTMHLRNGLLHFDVFPQPHAFAGPVAVLIDGGSASTSEVFAAGLRDTHRARVFGEASAGAALPSSFLTLPTGDLLQYAIADVQTPLGVLIEGVGVLPDEKIIRSRADLTAGRDPVLAAAQAWLKAAQLKPGAASPASSAHAP